MTQKQKAFYFFFCRQNIILILFAVCVIICAVFTKNYIGAMLVAITFTCAQITVMKLYLNGKLFMPKAEARIELNLLIKKKFKGDAQKAFLHDPEYFKSLYQQAYES